MCDRSARRDSAPGPSFISRSRMTTPPRSIRYRCCSTRSTSAATSGVVFAALRPQGSHIEVGVIAVADVPLSPLGSAARSSARQLIGRTPAQSDESVVVALDVSASMRPWFADGSAAAVTDIVVGVAAAAGIRNVSCGVRRGGGHAGGCRRVRCARHRRRGPGRRGAKGAAAVVRRCALVAAGAWSPHHRLRRLSDFGCPATAFR